jgi:hypothetical protein
MALALADETIEVKGIDPNGDLLDGVPVLSPVAWTLGYHYPVHRVSHAFRPEAEEPTFLLVYRDRHDAIGFLELNPVAARLLELLRAAPTTTGRELLERIAIEINCSDYHVVIDAGTRVLHDLRRRDVVIGSVSPQTLEH